MSEIDTGIGATIGAAVVGAVAAAREIFTRKKTRPSKPPPPSGEGAHVDAPIASRLGRLMERVMHVEQEMAMMRQDFALKLDKLEESVDELYRSRVKTDELLPLIRDQIKELRDDLRETRRHKDGKE